MRFSLRTRRLPAAILGLVPALLMLVSCGDGDAGPTLPTQPGAATATLTGTVVQGSGSAALTTKGRSMGLAGVTVRVAGTGKSTATDSSGRFTLTSVPVGSVELEFDRGDIHARGRVTLSAGGTHDVTFSIVGSRAVFAPGGHAGEEIEGLVSAIDAGAGTLTVLDQRLGAAVILTDASTLVRTGDTTIELSEIEVGMRVHVKALLQDDGTYLATEVHLQSDKIGGNRKVAGTVESVNETDSSFVVQAGGTVTVLTNASTRFRKRGQAASFSDLAEGVAVDVQGVLQPDGSVLARQIKIEG